MDDDFYIMHTKADPCGHVKVESVNRPLQQLLISVVWNDCESDELMYLSSISIAKNKKSTL